MAHKSTETHSVTARRYAVQLGARGRVVLPAELRRLMALEEGDTLVLAVEPDGTARLAPLERQVEKARGLYASLAPGRSLADELIAERRAEARREEES